MIWRSSLQAPEPGVKRGPQSQNSKAYPCSSPSLYSDTDEYLQTLCLCPQSLGNEVLIYGVCGTLNGTRRGDRVKKGMTFRV